MASPAIETQAREGEEPVKLPPTVDINRMADKFKEAMGKKEAAPDPAPAPAPVPAPKPAAEPKVPEAKKAEQTVTIKTEKPKEAPKIPHENFKVLETQRDEFKTKWEQAEARAKELESKTKEIEAKVPEDYEQLKTSLAEAEQFRQRFYVETSPQFKAAFDDKIQESIEDAKEIVGAAHSEAVAELLVLPPSTARDKKIEELTENLTAFQQAALVKSFTEVRRLQKERNAELAKSQENYKNLKTVESERTQKARLAQQEATDRAIKLTIADASKQFQEFQALDGNEEHNMFVADNQKLMREIATADLVPENKAKMAMWAVKGMASQRTDAIRDALISKLQQQLKEVTEASPAITGQGKKGESTRPMTAAEKYKQALTEGIPTKT